MYKVDIIFLRNENGNIKKNDTNSNYHRHHHIMRE